MIMSDNRAVWVSIVDEQGAAAVVQWLWAALQIKWQSRHIYLLHVNEHLTAPLLALSIQLLRPIEPFIPVCLVLVLSGSPSCTCTFLREDLH